MNGSSKAGILRSCTRPLEQWRESGERAASYNSFNSVNEGFAGI
jgi:hypothetical protein